MGAGDLNAGPQISVACASQSSQPCRLDCSETDRGIITAAVIQSVGREGVRCGDWTAESSMCNSRDRAVGVDEPVRVTCRAESSGLEWGEMPVTALLCVQGTLQ